MPWPLLRIVVVCRSYDSRQCGLDTSEGVRVRLALRRFPSFADGRLLGRSRRCLLGVDGAVNTLCLPVDSGTLLCSMALANHVRSVVGKRPSLMSLSDNLTLKNFSVTLANCHKISDPIVH